MPRALSAIGFDADDTLWHNERLFRMTEARFVELLSDYADPRDLPARLLEAEKRNLARYGYGVKGFTLSMIETALEVTEGRAPGYIIRAILDAGREMLAHPVRLLPGAAETLARLAGDYRLLLITKGDLFDQERKVAQSGLGEFFCTVEIVSEKTAAVYERAFTQHGEGPARAMMVGNSLKSDVLPAIEAGAWGVHAPHELTWTLERCEPPRDAPRYREIARLDELPDLVAEIG
ncbi:MAG: HAD family hydrolase [Amphiplicatus sp.]